jgi:hypothetical protein
LACAGSRGERGERAIDTCGETPVVYSVVRHSEIDVQQMSMSRAIVVTCLRVYEISQTIGDHLGGRTGAMATNASPDEGFEHWMEVVAPMRYSDFCR